MHRGTSLINYPTDTYASWKITLKDESSIHVYDGVKMWYDTIRIRMFIYFIEGDELKMIHG